jgi:mono/diheme cytochrome c family protein
MKYKHHTNRLLSCIVYAGFLSAGLILSGCEKDYHYIAPAPTQPVSLSMDLQPIFNASCIGCHDGSLDPDLRDGFSHASLWATGDIDTLNPAGSVLYVRVTLPSATSGAMPPGGPALSSSETALVLKWIQDGAPNN